MTPLLAGTALALAALAFVLYPLFREPFGVAPRRARGRSPSVTTAVDALREIEFDHATGKLSERDYAALRATYTQRAVEAMRRDGRAAPVCTRCGPRPEPEAIFCSDCGAALSD